MAEGAYKVRMESNMENKGNSNTNCVTMMESGQDRGPLSLSDDGKREGRNQVNACWGGFQ
jgi:hypothetical protein